MRQEGCLTLGEFFSIHFSEAVFGGGNIEMVPEQPFRRPFGLPYLCIRARFSGPEVPEIAVEDAAVRLADILIHHHLLDLVVFESRN